VFSSNLLCKFSVHNISVTHNMFLSEHTFTVTVLFVMYDQYAQHYCNTKCVAVRTHCYRPHSTICYVRSVCTTLLYDTMCCCQNTQLHTVTLQLLMYFQCASLHLMEYGCIINRLPRSQTT
jgi:hypothetical protein